MTWAQRLFSLFAFASTADVGALTNRVTTLEALMSDVQKFRD